MKFNRIILGAMLSCLISVLPANNCNSQDRKENNVIKSSDTSNIIDVSKFGAKGDGKTDDTSAVQKAVSALIKKGSGTTLLFPKGKYVLNVPLYKEVDAAVSLDGLEGVTIDGQGSELVAATQKMNVISIKNSKNVTVRNLSVYWDKPYFSQGKVIGSTAGSVDIRVDDNYPIDGTERIEAMMDYDPVTRMPLARFDMFGSAITKKELVAPQTLRLSIKTKWETPDKTKYVSETFSKLPTGTLILLRHAIYGQYGLDINVCENVLIENVNVWGVPGMAVHMTQCKDTRVKKLTIEPMPGTDRLMSTTADAFFVMFPMGELTIEDTKIEASGDDCLPIAGKFLHVTDIVDKNTLKLNVEIGWKGPTPQTGDKVDFYRGDNLLPRKTLTVEKAQYDIKEKKYAIKFKETVTEAVSVGDVAYDSAFTSSKIVVRNTVLGANRSRAALVSARNVVFDNVRIHNTGLAGVMVFADKGRSSRPGPPVENMSFKNCVFDSCALSPLVVYTGAPSPGTAQKGVSVTGCKFTENAKLRSLRAKGTLCENILFYQAAIYFTDVDKGLISGNTFAGYGVSLYLANTNGVSVEENRCTDASPSKIVINGKTNRTLALKGNLNLVEDDDTSKYKIGYLYYTDMR